MTQPEPPPSAPETSELLQRSRRGDADAFGQLYRRYHRLALHAAVRTTTSVDAADVTAEAFVRIWHALTTGGGPRREFAAYLVTTVRNIATSAAIRRRREVTGVVEAGGDERGSAVTPASRDHASDLAERDLVTQALMSLPERWRWVLWMVEVEGCTTADLAHDMGMPRNGVSALLVRARRGLRAAWLQAHVDRHPGRRACWDVMERLGAFAAGSATAARRRSIRRHLAGCAACRAEAERLEGLLASIGDVPLR